MSASPKKLNINTSATVLMSSNAKVSKTEFVLHETEPINPNDEGMPMLVRSLTGFGLKPLATEKRKPVSPPQIVEKQKEEN